MRAALYCRVSTGRQAERDLSIPDQLKQLRAHCQAKGWTVAQEYIESGASARDDRRLEFQQMVSEAVRGNNPFDVILCLTTSRFFRDATAARVYKRHLAKHGVRVVAIHQEVGNDPLGNLVEGLFELIDEFESNINEFHTLRAMKENARQGYYNGSKPRFGFRVVEAPDG